METGRDLEGKTALVTGSGRNLGRAILLEFAARGANVVVNARSNRAEAEAVAAEARALGADALVALGDVGDPDAVRAIVGEAQRRFPAIDISVSNAATRPHQGVLDVSAEDWRRALAISPRRLVPPRAGGRARDDRARVGPHHPHRRRLRRRPRAGSTRSRAKAACSASRGRSRPTSGAMASRPTWSPPPPST